MEWSNTDSNAEFASGDAYEPLSGQPQQIPPAASGVELVQSRLESLSGNLKALEARVWDTRESGERVRERFIDALEILDTSFTQHQQETVERVEQSILRLSGAVEELRIQTSSDAARNAEMLWEGVGKLEAKVSRIEGSGRETQERLARAIATLSVAAEDWRAATPGLFDGPTAGVQESLAKLDDSITASGQDLAERLEQYMGTLALSVQAWKDEIVHTSNRNDEKIWTGLAGLEAKLSAQTAQQLAGLETRVAARAEATLTAGVNNLTDRLFLQMKALEDRVNERQAAMITLIIGGGISSGMGLPEPELSNAEVESLDDQA